MATSSRFVGASIFLVIVAMGVAAAPATRPVTRPAASPSTPTDAERKLWAATLAGDVDTILAMILFDNSDRSDHREAIKKGLAMYGGHVPQETIVDVHQEGDCASIVVKWDAPINHHKAGESVWVRLRGQWLQPMDKPDDQQLSPEQWHDMRKCSEWAAPRVAEIDPPPYFPKP